MNQTTHHDVLEERPGDDHERLVDEVHDSVLDGDVGPHDPRDDHPPRVRPVADHRVGAHNDLFAEKSRDNST